MNVQIASLMIKNYQLADLINILLTSDYIIEIKNTNEERNTSLVTVYKNFNKVESEEK